MATQPPKPSIARRVVTFLDEHEHHVADLKDLGGLPLCELRADCPTLESKLQSKIERTIGLLARTGVIRLISTGPDIGLALVHLTPSGQAFANDLKSLTTGRELLRRLYQVQDGASGGFTQTIRDADRFTCDRVALFIRDTLMPLDHSLDARISKMTDMGMRARAYAVHASAWPQYGVPLRGLYDLVALAFPTGKVTRLPVHLLKKKYAELWSLLCAACKELGHAEDAVELFFACSPLPEHPQFLAAVQSLLASGDVTISEFREILDGEESGTNGEPEPVPGPVLRMGDTRLAKPKSEAPRTATVDHPAIDKADLAILETVGKSATVSTLDDIVHGAKIGKTTAVNKRKHLIADGLLEVPNGKKSVRLTPVGRNVLEHAHATTE